VTHVIEDGDVFRWRYRLRNAQYLIVYNHRLDIEI
jgi:hypothetical protein